MQRETVSLSLNLLLDEGVPDPVGSVFEAAGHLVIYANRTLPRGSSDQVVCMAAVNAGAILVAADHDMKNIAKSNGISNKRFRTLSIVKLSCRKPNAATRVSEAILLIEAEWAYATAGNRRLFIEIQESVIRIMRPTMENPRLKHAISE